jgi:hypothetical protein
MVSPGRERRAYVAADRAQAHEGLSLRAAQPSGSPKRLGEPAQIRDHFMRGLGVKQAV